MRCYSTRSAFDGSMRVVRRDGRSAAAVVASSMMPMATTYGRSATGGARRIAPAVATRLSPHQVGVADLLDGARWLGRYPNRVVLLGFVPASMELSVGLSPRVRASLPDLVEHLIEEAASLGVTFEERDVDDARRRDRAIDVARLAGMV